MRFVSAAEISDVLSFPPLIEALEAAFRHPPTVPVRHHHTLPRPDGAATLLLMPAWTVAGDDTDVIGTKLVTIFPGNGRRGVDTVTGLYVLMSGATGAPLAVLDGRALTLWRTAAASALAARHLALPGARRLGLIGAGALAPCLVRAHASVRPIVEVAIWNRSPERAERLAGTLCAEGFAVEVATSRADVVSGADIVCSATLSPTPLVEGRWLRPGQHVDLVGGFTPAMREADDDAIRRARVYVDTRAGALKEAGDVVEPIRTGVLAEDAVVGDLFDLAAGRAPGRRNGEDITLFKSVGTALEDLAAAALVWRRLSGG